MNQIKQHSSMNAVTYHKYGSPNVLEFETVAKPIPKDDEVLIKIHAAGTNAADWRLLRATPFFTRFVTGLLKPKNPILGADVAGVVEAVGPNATQFQRGEAVFGTLTSQRGGGFAEYASGSETLLAAKPATLSFVEAAALPMAAGTALQGLRDVGQIQAGQNVLIHGASGGVGSFAVQIAKYYGATVTAVCSTAKVELAHSLGADRVIDYTREDFAQNGQQYDLIFASNGNRTLSDYERALTPTGIFVVAGGSMSQLFKTILLGPLKSKSGGKRFRDVMEKPNQADLIVMKELAEAGHITPVIDCCYPLNQVPEAIRYLEAGHARGKVVITVIDDDRADAD